MKKIIYLVLALVFILTAMAGCKNNNINDVSSDGSGMMDTTSMEDDYESQMGSSDYETSSNYTESPNNEDSSNHPDSSNNENSSNHPDSSK